MSKPVSRQKAVTAIGEVSSPAMRKKLLAMLDSKRSRRHPSEAYGRKHKNGLKDEEYILLARAHYKYKVPFRPLEAIFHLFPASGNGAQRGAWTGKKLLRRKGRAKAKAA